MLKPYLIVWCQTLPNYLSIYRLYIDTSNRTPNLSTYRPFVGVANSTETRSVSVPRVNHLQNIAVTASSNMWAQMRIVSDGETVLYVPVLYRPYLTLSGNFRSITLCWSRYHANQQWSVSQAQKFRGAKNEGNYPVGWVAK